MLQECYKVAKNAEKARDCGLFKEKTASKGLVVRFMRCNNSSYNLLVRNGQMLS